jgi:TetR/AcrR family transcriptional regulator
VSTAQRWGKASPTNTEDARQRLIDAASTCIERVGLAKTTVEDVAGEAAVSRQTIYRYFANRDELLLEALIAELERTQRPDPSEELLRSIRTPEDAVAALVEASVHTLDTIRRNPKLAALLDTEGDSVRSTISGASGVVFQHEYADLRAPLELGQRTGFINPQLDVAEIVEWLMRITLSLLMVPGPRQRSLDEIREYLLTFLTPVLVPPAASDERLTP